MSDAGKRSATFRLAYSPHPPQIAIDWAGIILHKITGKTLGEWSKENIFDPVGVKDLAYLSKVTHQHEWDGSRWRLTIDSCSSIKLSSVDSSACTRERPTARSSPEVCCSVCSTSVHACEADVCDGLQRTSREPSSTAAELAVSERWKSAHSSAHRYIGVD